MIVIERPPRTPDRVIDARRLPDWLLPLSSTVTPEEEQAAALP